MERTISAVVFDPWAECGSVKFGVVLPVLYVSNDVMLLEALTVDETSVRTAVDLQIRSGD
jgi:hypothetical protein